jgi:hypothetical protein
MNVLKKRKALDLTGVRNLEQVHSVIATPTTLLQSLLWWGVGGGEEISPLFTVGNRTMNHDF